jgi:lipoprotein-anchoring transpeptidase ErfK/SrfK
MQYMTVWEGDQVVNGTYVSTGKPGFETPTGTFRVLYKYVSQTMAGTIGGETYYVPDVPWVMYFTNYGHAIHGAYWHNDFGTTRSHGCINLPTYNTPGWSYDFARWLFYWAPMGMRVVIHY